MLQIKSNLFNSSMTLYVYNDLYVDDRYNIAHHCHILKNSRQLKAMMVQYIFV